jgi:cell division inhibitor SepF
MDISKRGRSGGMLDSIKDRLGLTPKNDQDYDEYYDDYDAYSDNYDDYSTNDEDDQEDDEPEDTKTEGYSSYPPVTTRTAGTNRTRRTSYTASAASDLGERRRSSAANPPLVSRNDVRSSGEHRDVPSGRRRPTFSTARASVGRASDFIASGSAAPQAAPRDDQEDRDHAKKDEHAGYQSLFASTAKHAAENAASREQSVTQKIPMPASSVGIGTRATAASHTDYSDYAGTAGASTVPRSSRGVTTLRPMSYGEVETVARSLKEGDVVVLVLTSTPGPLSKRILDFAFGVASALDASVDCIADKVFVLSRGMALTDAERMQLRSQGVIAS